MTSPALILAEDARIVPVTALDAAVAAELDPDDGDAVVERSGGRHQGQLVSAGAARLLGFFETASTVPEAVVQYCQAEGGDPAETLDAAVPVLERFLDAGVLRPADADAPGNRLNPGDRVGGAVILRTLRIAEDTEVHQARLPCGTLAAVKCPAPGSDPAAFEAEIAANRRFADSVGPRVHAAPVQDGAPVLITDWIDGVPARARAETLRAAGDRTGLRRLLVAIVDAAAHIHKRDFIHGDIRAGNVLVDRDERVWLIDFGMTARPGRLAPRGRTLDYAMLEPEAVAALERDRLPPLTAAAEQYALGVLLYGLASGAAPSDVPLDRAAALAAIAGRQPAAFPRRGAAAWPALEAVLARALSPDPSARFTDLGALASALRTVPVAAPGARDMPTDLIERLIDAAARPGQRVADLFPEAPSASVHSGAGGLAFWLYRAAMVRGDGGLLALADHWLRLAEAEGRAGLVAPATGIGATDACVSAPLHDPTGLAAIGAAIALARDARPGTLRAVDRFVTGLARPARTEPFRGAAGQLAAAHWLTALLRGYGVDHAGLGGAVARLSRRIAGDAEGMLAQSMRGAHLGMAHGLAGRLAVLLPGCPHDGGGTGTRLVSHGLDWLAAAGEACADGLAWPGTHRPGMARCPDFAPGWCSGSAGHALLWAAAFRAGYGEAARTRAVSAGQHAWAHPSAAPDLCCGLSGRALALADLGRLTGDEVWHVRARTLAVRAAGSVRADGPLGLYRGALGPALALIELDAPCLAPWPLWPGVGA